MSNIRDKVLADRKRDVEQDTALSSFKWEVDVAQSQVFAKLQEDDVKKRDKKKIEEDEKKRKEMDAVFFLYDRSKLDILNTVESYHAIQSDHDYHKLNGGLNFFEISLLASHAMPLTTIFQKASLEEHGFDSDHTPSLDQCLSWLTRAGGCKMSDLLPPAEIFPEAQKHADHLAQVDLPFIEDEAEREDVIISMVCRALDFMELLNYKPIPTEQMAILLFVLSRISLDRLARDNMPQKILGLMFRIFDCDELRKRQLIQEYSAICLHLHDDWLSMLPAFELIRNSACGCIGLLPILTSLLISKSERDELALGDLSELKKTEMIMEHLKVLSEILPEIGTLVDTRTLYTIYLLLDFAICPCVLAEIPYNDLDTLILRDLKHTSKCLKTEKTDDEKFGEQDDSFARSVIEIRVTGIIDRCRNSITCEDLGE